MNVLFMNPSESRSSIHSRRTRAGMDLASLAVAIPEHATRLIDSRATNSDEAREAIARAHIVAINITPSNASSALDMTRVAKNERCVTILCTRHQFQDPVPIALDAGVDVVIDAHDTGAFRGIIEYLDGNPLHVLLKSINGITFTDERGAIVSTGRMPPVTSPRCATLVPTRSACRRC